jgi:predicted DCC family thiol-disulfide oxidoreductase YuxK
MATNAAASPQAWIVYDGQCPFCSRYVRLIHLRETLGPVTLVDARQGGPIVEEVVARGLNLNEGMILKYQDRFYHGDQCIHMLALLSTPSNTFNRMNRAIFRSKAASRALYPILRASRNAALRLLGRAEIRQPQGRDGEPGS